MLTPDLERDLLQNPQLCERAQNDRDFAKALYGALCNNRYRHESDPESMQLWSCTWRYAGGILSEMTNSSGGYLDFYCSGNEGCVTDGVRFELRKLGWTDVPYPDQF